MTKVWHINTTTGRVTECRVTVGHCPFGGESGRDNHHTDKAAALKAFETSMVKELFQKAVVRDELKEMDYESLVIGQLSLGKDYGLNVEKLSTAIELAGFLHHDQKRANRGHHETTPYIEHPLRVSYRLMKWGVKDPDVITASILHDTVEDCSRIFVSKVIGKKLDEETSRVMFLSFIRDEFGNNVARLVKSVTNDYQPPSEIPLTLEEKYKVYKDHLEKEITDNPKALLIKLGDFTDNASGLHHNDVPGFERKIKKMASKYLPCVDVFIRELSKPGVPLSSEVIHDRITQLEATRVRLNRMIAKYRDLPVH